MVRLIVTVSVSVLALASCKSNEARPTSETAGSAAGTAVAAAAPAKPVTALEQAQRWAPKDKRVAAAGISMAGIELFVLTDAKPVPEGEYAAGTLVGVQGGVGGKILEGRELVREASVGKPDRKVLARIAMWVAQREGEGEILDAASNAEQRKAKVGRPTIKGNTLVFWVWTADVPRTLERGALDLTTGVLELEPFAVSRDKAIANAIATLVGVSVSRHPSAIRTLVAACADPRARQAILRALEDHPRDRTRMAILGEVHKCGAPAVGPLINMMEHDKSAMVRTEAAGALGRTGDPRARPALAKASRGEDANLAWAAKNALGKLK